MSKKKRTVRGLSPSTIGSIPTEKIKKAVLEVARARQEGQLPDIAIGDTVDVHLKFTQRGKNRIRVVTGRVVDRRGTGEQETFTVAPCEMLVKEDREVPFDSQQSQNFKVKRSSIVPRVKLRFLHDGGGELAASRGKQSR